MEESMKTIDLMCSPTEPYIAIHGELARELVMSKRKTKKSKEIQEAVDNLAFVLWKYNTSISEFLQGK